MIEEGSCWTGTSGKVFLVLNRVELDGHVWIYYRETSANEDQEVKQYSCYEESFLERFHKLPECPKER